MTSIREIIRRRFAPVKPLAAGMYHYIAPPEDPRNYRLHLRLEPDGNGVLIVNAATILHLNQTAAEYAYHLVQRTPEQQVARLVAARYHVHSEQALADYRDLVERIDSMVTTVDLDPVEYLGFDRHVPYSGAISAPYRLDCAITYRLPAEADPSAAPTKRVDRELTTSEWELIMDKAWQAGIPHIIFTGGEPTLRDDLAQLIAHTEHTGQVSGLLTDGLRLADSAYLTSLLQTGLDHAMIVLQPDNPQAWVALENTLVDDLFVAVHLTLTPNNADSIPDLLARLKQMGVKAISLSSMDPALHDRLQAARDLVANLQLSLVWDLPVPYSASHPVALEIEDNERIDGAGRAWMYVEPDGDVLPTQGVNQVLGNMLKDPWEIIWQKKV
jgi:hypothetical protein